jgi:ligand-binding sensor domain-containing protein/signal transduction histidine kinase
MRRAAAFAASLALAVAACWGNPTPTPAATPEVVVVTVDPQVVRLPVVEGSDIRFVQLGRSQGLSQQRVTNIAQDERGFLWFGTQYGLNRYDGYHFKIFKNDPADPTSLCGVEVSALLIDRTGALWVGCDYALDRYDPFTETFVHYQLARASALSAMGSVRHISQDRAGILWLSTGAGLYRIDPSNGSTVRFAHDGANPFSLSSDDVRSSGEDHAGTFWVATRNGIDAFDRTNARVTEHVPLSESRDFSFYEDRQGVFWVLYASGNGLAVLDRKTHRLVRYSYGRDDLSTHPLTGVSSMLEDAKGNLWIGTFSDGLLRLDREHGTFVRYRNNSSDSDSLSENRITTLFADREGNVWVGFGATEPVFFPTRPPVFEVLPFDSSNTVNLGETLVNSIYEDRSGILWMGTTGALVRLDRRNRKLTHLEVPGNGIASDVLAILEDSSGALWIGTSGQGLYRRSPTTGRLTVFRHHDDDPASLSDDTVLQIFFDHAGTMWVATAHGLGRFDAVTQTFTTFRNSGGDPSLFGDIVEHPAGTLWVSTRYSGVLRFDVRTQQFMTANEPRNQSAGGYRRVNSLMLDHSGALWAATQNGVDRYERQTRQITHYSERDGLASNDVHCILEDSIGGLWMSTSSGISHLDPQRKVFSNYSQADGLPGPDFTGYRGCHRSASGEMFFGGFSGAVAVHPEKIPQAAYVPPVVLTSFQLFGRPLVPGPGSPLKRAIDYADQLLLRHDQNSFSFEFSALSFGNPSTNRYRFKLEGLEQSWQEVGSDRRYATYTTLPPGKYRFRVQGATIRGPWSDPGVSVPITIEPAWWQTWRFNVLSGVLMLLVAAALYASRLRILHRQFDIRLQARDTERSRIARELHDSLLQGYQGLLFRLQAARNLLPQRPEAAASALETAMELGDKAMDESRAAVRELRTSIPATRDLADSLTELGDELALHGQEGSATYHVLVEGRPRAIAPLVRDEIYRIAREAVRNAAEHARARRIEAELDYGTTQFSLRVRDDGIGIDTETLERRRAGHWGLQGMRERAESFGSRFNVWSESGVGTEIELLVPAAVCYGRQRRQVDSAHGKS